VKAEVELVAEAVRAGEQGGGSMPFALRPLTSRSCELRAGASRLAIEFLDGEAGGVLPLLLLLGTAEAMAPSETRSRNSRFEVLVIDTPFPIARVALAFTPFQVTADALLMVALRTSSCHLRCVLCQWLSFSPGAGLESGGGGGV